MEWILQGLPDRSVTINNWERLRHWFVKHDPNLPHVLIMSDEDGLDLKLRRLISDNYGRVSFGNIKYTKSMYKLRSKVMELIGKPHIPLPLIIHMADPDLTHFEAISVAQATDFELDLQLTKFVALVSPCQARNSMPLSCLHLLCMHLLCMHPECV